MFSFHRLPEFHRALRASEEAWSAPEAAATLRFTQGLLFSVMLVTPFWVMVGFALHAVIK